MTTTSSPPRTERDGRLPSELRADLVLNPSARVLWRSRRAVQLELGERAVVLDGIDGATVRRLAGRPITNGVRPADLPDDAVASLYAAGFLVRRHLVSAVRPVPRLAAELAALRVRHGERAPAVLTERRTASVAVHGAARVAGPVASLLGAAGVGRVVVVAGSPGGPGGEARLAHAMPGGLTPDDEGERFTRAAAAAVRRAAPDCDTSPLPVGQSPDLVVLALDAPVETDVWAALHARGVAHLAVRAAGDHAVVGPLVLPGRSSCLRCADLHRTERDQAWSALAVQLAVPPRHGQPSDVGLTALIAGLTTVQALGYLDGDEPATLGGTLEVCLPDWRIRRRSWPTHPDCDCGAHASTHAHWAQ